MNTVRKLPIICACLVVMFTSSACETVRKGLDKVGSDLNQVGEAFQQGLGAMDKAQQTGQRLRDLPEELRDSNPLDPNRLREINPWKNEIDLDLFGDPIGGDGGIEEPQECIACYEGESFAEFICGNDANGPLLQRLQLLCYRGCKELYPNDDDERADCRTGCNFVAELSDTPRPGRGYCAPNLQALFVNRALARELEPISEQHQFGDELQCYYDLSWLFRLPKCQRPCTGELPEPRELQCEFTGVSL